MTFHGGTFAIHDVRDASTLMIEFAPEPLSQYADPKEKRSRLAAKALVWRCRRAKRIALRIAWCVSD